MKQFYFPILLTLFMLSVPVAASAQAYTPLLDSINEWHYTGNMIGVRTNPGPCSYPYWPQVEFTVADTVMNSFTYKKLEESMSYCYVGYLREDTAARKVYFMDNNFSPEVLLYDFSLQVNDTFPVSMVDNNFYQDGDYIVDSISMVSSMHGPKRYFYLRCHSCSPSPTMTWVEGVGNLNGLVYTHSINQQGAWLFSQCAGDQYNPLIIMTCFFHDTRVYEDLCMIYQATHSAPCLGFTDSCTYGNICGSVNDISSIASAEIFPNPSCGKTTLHLDVTTRAEFTVVLHDLSGKQILREYPLGIISAGKKEVELDLSGMSDGIYLLELKTAEGSVYRRLLIAH